MKIMNVSFSIDVKNVAHVEALTVFMAVLGEHPVQSTLQPSLGEPKAKKAPKPVEQTEQQIELKQEDAEIKSIKLTDSPEHGVKGLALREGAEEPEAETPKASAVDLETLRRKVAELVKASAENREAIKAKLGELRATGVSNLSPTKYEVFNDYLTTL